jgi:hypothetical protein
MAISCTAFSDFLARKTEHWDDLILLDRRPRDDAWIGQTMTGKFEAFDGVTKKYNRFHGAYPDLSGSWTDVPGGPGCVTAPCSPDESEIGWGVTQIEHGIQRRQYRTKPLCWELSMTADWANKQLGSIVQYLRRAKDQITGNWIKTYSLLNARNLYIANQAGTVYPISTVTVPGQAADILTIPNTVVVGKLQYPFLQRFIGPLRREGYFDGEQAPEVPMYKLITDDQTAWELREGNPDLNEHFRFSDFVKGGSLYKYGVSTEVGNFMIAYDNLPMRYQYGGDGNLYRVYPYTNAPTTIGIKDALENAYETAPFQISVIWNKEAVTALTMDWRPPTAEGMNFKPMNYDGQWKFYGGDVLVYKNSDGTQCVIDNKTRQQGYWWSRFQMGIRPEKTELVRFILHQRRVPCMVDIAPCPAAYPAYVTQNHGAANATCPA